MHHDPPGRQAQHHQSITDVVYEATHLFQTEIRLIRAEINEKISRLAAGGTLIAVGLIAALAALFLLLQAAVTWLVVAGVPEQWGYLVVGLVVGAVSAGLLLKGAKDIKATNLTPDRTLDQLRADVATVKEHVT